MSSVAIAHCSVKCVLPCVREGGEVLPIEAFLGGEDRDISPDIVNLCWVPFFDRSIDLTRLHDEVRRDLVGRGRVTDVDKVLHGLRQGAEEQRTSSETRQDTPHRTYRADGEFNSRSRAISRKGRSFISYCDPPLRCGLRVADHYFLCDLAGRPLTSECMSSQRTAG